MLPQLSDEHDIRMPNSEDQMSPFRRSLICASVFAVLGALSACDRSPRVATTDSLLARDLTLAASSTTTVPSVLGDTAAAATTPTREPQTAAARPTPARASSPRSSNAPRPTSPTTVAAAPAAATPVPTRTETAPSAPAPAPTSTSSNTTASNAADAGRSKRIGRGTALVGKTGSEICSLANRPGDRLVASLGAEVVSEDGARLPAGTPILVEMAPADAGRDFVFTVKAVQLNGVLIPVEGTVQVEGATTERRISKGGDKGKVVGGAIAGAILGRVLGGGTKGAVIGAAGGAAAGTVAASRNSVTEKCLPAGATLTVTLTAPIVLTPGAL